MDEGIWEEMESGLVHHGRLTPNFVALMVFGGADAAAGLYAGTLEKAVAFVAASIIAPGYEPIAKIPLSIVLRRWPILRQALISVSVGCAVLIATAILTLLALQAIGGVHVAALGSVPEVRFDLTPSMGSFVVSACSAAAGAVMIASFRETVLAGPLIGLSLVPITAMLGGAIAARNAALAEAAIRQLATNMGLALVLGLAVFSLKQRLRHERKPMV